MVIAFFSAIDRAVSWNYDTHWPVESPPLATERIATENLLENTDGVVFSRDGSLLDTF